MLGLWSQIKTRSCGTSIDRGPTDCSLLDRTVFSLIRSLVLTFYLLSIYLMYKNGGYVATFYLLNTCEHVTNGCLSSLALYCLSSKHNKVCGCVKWR